MASKQLDSAFKGPVYSHVTETVSGLTTILTYGQKKMFINEFEEHLDAMTRANLTHLFIIRSFSAFTSFLAISVMIGGMMLGLGTLT